jgi:hypothetical protein
MAPSMSPTLSNASDDTFEQRDWMAARQPIRRNWRRRSMVGLGRLELPTSRLSSARSNQLSYKPEPLLDHTGKRIRRHDHGPRGLKQTPRLNATLSATFSRHIDATAARARPGRKRNEGGEVPQTAFRNKFLTALMFQEIREVQTECLYLKDRP